MASSNTLTVIDNRTAPTFTFPIENGTIRAMDLRKIRTGPYDFGLRTYDPAFMNTASCHSSITFIDGVARTQCALWWSRRRLTEAWRSSSGDCTSEELREID
jgi:hypothetical protein